MSHEIDTMAYTGKRPWHGLGTAVSGAMTAEEAMVKGGLDWGVTKLPAYYKDEEGEFHPIEEKYATVRQDTGKALGVVGDVYEPLQNKSALSFFDAMVQEKLAMYHTVGSLKQGRRIWLMAKLPKTLRVAGKDDVELYTLLTNSHDGKGSVELMNTPIRVVCWNTLTRARNAAVSSFRIRHCGRMGEAIQEARDILGIITRSADDFLAEANHLVSKKLTKGAVEELLASVGLRKLEDKHGKPNENREDERLTVMALMDAGKGNGVPGIKGTLWAGYNGITEWVDHVWKSRSEENRLERTWFGGGAVLKARAYQKAMELAG